MPRALLAVPLALAFALRPVTVWAVILLAGTVHGHNWLEGSRGMLLED